MQLSVMDRYVYGSGPWTKGHQKLKFLGSTVIVGGCGIWFSIRALVEVTLLDLLV